jgi:hypothetical protein
MDDITTIEEQRMGELQQERLATDSIQDEAVPSPKTKLSFGQKISQHWLILATAVLFDLFGMIPFVGVVSNFIFGLILYLYFGSKKKKKAGGSELVRIALPILGGSIIDFFIGILPVNIGAALIRIALS